MNSYESVEVVRIDDFENYFIRFTEIFILLMNDPVLIQSQKAFHRKLLEDLYISNKVLSEYTQVKDRSNDVTIELGGLVSMLNSIMKDGESSALNEIALALDLFLRNIGVRSHLVVENAHGKTQILLQGT